MDIENKSRSARVAILIIILLLVGTSNSENVTMDFEKQFRKSEHKMAHYWRVQILFTPIGIGFCAGMAVDCRERTDVCSKHLMM